MVPAPQDLEKWSAGTGFSGRNKPDLVVAQDRIWWSAQNGSRGRIDRITHKEQKIDELVTQLVARRLYDILTGFKQLSDLFALAGYAPPVSDLRGAGIPVAAGSTPSESGAPGETNTGPKQGRRPRSAPPEDQVELIGDPAKPEEETAQSEDTDATQRALQKLKECAFAMMRQSALGPPTPPPAEEAADQTPKDKFPKTQIGHVLKEGRVCQSPRTIDAGARSQVPPRK